MKILLGVHHFFPLHTAGTEVLTLELARSLRAKGHNVSIVTCVRHESMDARVNPWMSKDVYDSFEVYQMNFGLARSYDPVGIHVSAPEIVNMLRKLVEALSPDLVHFKHIKGFSVAAISEIRKLHIPVFFSATDYWTICPRTNLIKAAGQELCQGPKNPAQCLRCYLPYLPAWGTEIALKLTSQKAGKISGKMASLYSLKHRVREMTEHINESNEIFVSTFFWLIYWKSMV